MCKENESEELNIDALVNEGIANLDISRKENILKVLDTEVSRLEKTLTSDFSKEAKLNAASLVVHAYTSNRKLNKELDDLTKK